ncbi:hypothetical protein FRC12_018330 [Ceratobasidium sp. 428]|nr:hypothetical protein FRC12_018330 [Ceratobasidium sp. 428]
MPTQAEARKLKAAARSPLATGSDEATGGPLRFVHSKPHDSQSTSGQYFANDAVYAHIVVL